ncbi:MAG: radical SAM protein [Spirochaetia bacterium]|nr:radical SAM protein [Spirochaetota bacterium]MCX8096977.1 radical SAM protein [Spirochaetota bacterium]MDW8111940.1 radical SAM protein [Spirochaetia bacterium]
MKLKYVFGPLPSRRLGMSLGIDLVPHKICNYDCVFCEIGITKKTVVQRKEYVKKETILQELDMFFSSFDGRVDHITLTGAGETTLNSKLGEIISSIKSRYKYPVAVLTHSGNIYEEDVRRELSLADVVCPSLDAVSEDVFIKVNRPDRSISVDKVIEGLVRFREEYRGKMLLEVLLVKGINDDEVELHKIGQTCSMIKPDMVQINTVDRPGAYPFAKSLSSEELRRAKEIISIYYPKVEFLSRHYSSPESVVKDNSKLEEDIMSIMQRRPLTILDIVISEGIDFFRARELVTKLMTENKVEEIELNGNKFYRPFYVK